MKKMKLTYNWKKHICDDCKNPYDRKEDIKQAKEDTYNKIEKTFPFLKTNLDFRNKLIDLKKEDLGDSEKCEICHNYKQCIDGVCKNCLNKHFNIELKIELEKHLEG